MNRRNTWTPLLAMLACGIAALKASANGFGLPDQDAFATARGEAFVATADNPSAIYYNPAGIAQLKGNNFRAGLYGIYLDPSYNSPDGSQNLHTGKHFAAIPQLFYSYTAKDSPLSAGLGVYAPYGGNMDWPGNADLRQAGYSGSLKYITINPAVAFKLSPGLSVGGGVMINYGNLSMEQGIQPPTGARNINFLKFSGDGWSAGYNLGLLWQPLRSISFGATFRSSAQLDFRGTTEFQLQPHPYDASAQRNASASFDFPLTGVFGVSYRPTPKWNLEFDANYTDWSSFSTITLEQSPPPVRNPFQSVYSMNLNWQASWIYEFGVTRYFDNGWHVSAGYVFNQNSVPDQYYSPLAADLDRQFFTVGTGYKGRKLDFDVAYQFGYGPSHTVTGSMPPVSFQQVNASKPADGKYGFTSQALIVSVGFHF